MNNVKIHLDLTSKRQLYPFRSRIVVGNHLSSLCDEKHVVGVFFDLGKANDRTWRYDILRVLHSLGLRGNLSLFIPTLETASPGSGWVLTFPAPYHWGRVSRTVVSLASPCFAWPSMTAVSLLRDMHCKHYMDDCFISYASLASMLLSATSN